MSQQAHEDAKGCAGGELGPHPFLGVHDADIPALVPALLIIGSFDHAGGKIHVAQKAVFLV